jgi:hypothetical protein
MIIAFVDDSWACSVREKAGDSWAYSVREKINMYNEKSRRGSVTKLVPVFSLAKEKGNLTVSREVKTSLHEIYEGKLGEKDRPCEKEQIVHQNGEKCFHGVFEGKGTITCTSGIYNGNFKNWVPNGFGELLCANGNIYKGDFENGKFNGLGEFIWANGDTYKGDFRDDKCSGYGDLVYANGNVYIGNFNNGVFNGLGKFIYTNGKTYAGQWRDGKLVCGAVTQRIVDQEGMLGIQRPIPRLWLSEKNPEQIDDYFDPKIDDYTDYYLESNFE